MTAPAVEAEPACPDGSAAAPPSPYRAPQLVAVRRPFGSIAPATWDRLASRNPWATPFARWAFHRAWWDAYGASAHDQTMVVVDSAGVDAGSHDADDPSAGPVAIVPLMHRHEVEPADAERRTTLRPGAGLELTPVAPTAKAVFFGASYHTDYAAVLVAPDDVGVVAEAVVAALADPAGASEDHAAPWDVVDLRRLRCADPMAEALAAAFGRREAAEGWTLNLEREDVCPVVSLPGPAESLTFDGFLGTLAKKVRHEIRRKIRRAEAVGPVELVESRDPLADLDAFIDLHQRRWGAAGLFPPTPGGEASRHFVRCLFEGFGSEGPARLRFLTVGGRRIGAGITFEWGDTLAYYNAGLDPAARDLSPGVLLMAKYVELAIRDGRRRVDLLRGDEPYKYDWGASDEPIQRLLVRRSVGP